MFNVLAFQSSMLKLSFILNNNIIHRYTCENQKLLSFQTYHDTTVDKMTQLLGTSI